MKRPPPIADFTPDHSEGRLAGPAPAELGLVRYKRIWQMLISGVIIGLVGFVLITGYYKARGSARLSDCMGRERVLGQALEMYRNDNESRLPPGANWRWAVSSYVDLIGGATEGVEDIGRTVRPVRGFSSPMRCLANRTTVPISYLYLDPSELRMQYPDLVDDPRLPILVDEVHHRSVAVLRNDWSCSAVDRRAWVDERAAQFHIVRRPDWERTFAYYVPPPPPTGGY